VRLFLSEFQAVDLWRTHGTEDEKQECSGEFDRYRIVVTLLGGQRLVQVRGQPPWLVSRFGWWG